MSRRYRWIAIGLGIFLAAVVAEVVYGVFYGLGFNSLARWWPAGIVIGAVLGVLLASLFKRKRMQAALPVMNSVISLIVILEAVFWWYDFIPTITMPIFGLSLLLFLIAFFLYHYGKRLAASVGVIIHEVVNLALLIVVNFSWWYWSQSLEPTHCMYGGTLSRTESVYFTLTTMATVGYGDIHPVTDACRRIVSIQMIVGFIFAAIILALLASYIGQALNPSPDYERVLSTLEQVKTDVERLSKDLDELKLTRSEVSKAKTKNTTRPVPKDAR
jgi:hypothetical protein